MRKIKNIALWLRPAFEQGLRGRYVLFILSMIVCGSVSILTTSCSHNDDVDEIVEQTPEQPIMQVPISFSGNRNEGEDVSLATRAVTPLCELVDEFNVWGYKNMSCTDGNYGDLQKVFPGYVVEWQENSSATTTTNSSGWDYILTSHTDQTIKYWDWSSAAYRFFAVTPGYTSSAANEPNGPYAFTYEGLDAVPVYTGTPSHVDVDASAAKLESAPFFSRLWFSTGQLPTYADKQFGKPVTLEFVKPYARVRFQYKYVYPRVALILAAQSFKPTDDSKIIRKGTVTVSYPLVGTATREFYTTVGNTDPDPAVSGALDAFTEDYDPEDDSKEYFVSDNGWYTVLPNTAQGSYTLSLSINNVPRTAVVPAEYMQWKPGYSYTYVFKILDEGGIKIDLVESAVTPWTDVNANHEVYNW